MLSWCLSCKIKYHTFHNANDSDILCFSQAAWTFRTRGGGRTQHWGSTKGMNAQITQQLMICDKKGTLFKHVSYFSNKSLFKLLNLFVWFKNSVSQIVKFFINICSVKIICCFIYIFSINIMCFSLMFITFIHVICYKAL